MRIISLEIENILSIEKASISFEDSGLVLVEGWNYDTNRSNGAGKTAIFNCLSFAIYEDIPRKITKSEILRRDTKQGHAKCELQSGDDIWTVKRSRPKGVEFYKNGVIQNISQEEFEKNIRLNYQQFILTIYTPQVNSGHLTRFLSSPDAAKKEFLLQLLNLDKFKAIKDQVDTNVDSFQASIDLETNKINSSRARIETYEESLIDAQAVQSNIDKLEESLQDIEKDLLEASSVPKPDLSKYTKTEDGIKNKQNEIVKAKAQRAMLHSQYKEMSTQIHEYDADVACSECGSALDTPEARKSHADNQQKLKDKMSNLKTQIDDMDKIISNEIAITDLSKKIRDKKQQESADYQSAQLKASELKHSIDKHKSQIQSFSQKLNQNSDVLLKIDKLKENITLSNSKIEDLRINLNIYKTLSNIYSPTGAQAYVLDSIVDSFNEVISKYIDIISPNMSYTLNSFKETGKGDIVAKFSETLTKGGKEVSVGSLSGGEQKGVSLCVDFALLEVLETQFGMRLNPIILDEPFDGLDASGRELVIDLLENLARTRQIFVIDHSSEAKSMFSKIVRVELRNDISTIV